MKMMNKNYTFALTAALNETRLQPRDISDVNIQKQGELFYLSFCTDWQQYECYLDAASFQVLGLNFMPCTEEWCGSLEYMVASTVA